MTLCRNSIILAFVLAAATAAQDLDGQLASMLASAGFTGTVGLSIEARLGRPVDPKLANLGRLLFFDKIHSLHDDNTCAGCHSPTNGFGDTQSIAIGIQKTIWWGRTGKGRGISAGLRCLRMRHSCPG
jgi:cytochrome c peroxidase